MGLWDKARICPNCGSTDVGVDDSQVLTMMRLQEGYVCRDCGYTGIFPVVDENSIDEQRDAINDIDDEDLDALETASGPTKRRVLYGIAFFLAGIPPALFSAGVEGRLVGILSIAIGGTIMADYIANRDITETGDGTGTEDTVKDKTEGDTGTSEESEGE